MRNFRRFVVAGIVATYFLIFVGGLVRVSGAGMGCPDWPTCFGRWIPPTNISQLPADIDPAQFNFALAWIEYVNRLIGMIVGLFIGGAAIWALLKYRKYPKLLFPSIAAALLVAYQGWQGGRMIASHLDSMMVSVHMGLAFIIVCLMIYVGQQAYYIEKSSNVDKILIAGKARYWLGGLILLSIYQVAQGTQVRTALEKVADKFPLMQQSEFLSHTGLISTFHAILGTVIALLAWHVGTVVLKKNKSLSPMTKQITWSIMILGSLQLVIGTTLVLAGVPDLVQIFHLAISSLFVGMLVMLWTAFGYEGRTE